MKRIDRSAALSAILVAVALGVVVVRWGWTASHRGRFPLVSTETLEAILPFILVLAVALLIYWWIAKRGNGAK